MLNIQAIQNALRKFEIDGWLLYDFRGTNPLARRVLGLSDDSVGSRRWFYCIPARGEPHKLVHRIETTALRALPGSASVYLKWQELEAGVERLVQGMNLVAMEYSPNNANPYVSRVDAGTVELVRRFGCEVVSSGNLVQQFEAVWDDHQWQMHLEASEHTNAAFARTWSLIANRIRSGDRVTEYMVQQDIMQHFAEQGMTTYHPPIIGVGPHSGDPHFEPDPNNDTEMREGDFVLVDLWAKMDRPRGVYSDLTRVGYIGAVVPQQYEAIFQVVASARDAGIAIVKESFAAGEPLQGWQVDKATRDVIEAAGYGEFFIHRTGHSIGQETHGNGANMDNLEMRDERLVLPGTCFSIEPGVYLPEFGVRSEVNVFVDHDGNVHVTGGDLQQAVTPIMADY
ncbi:MAG: M24 family metallopeptidase [Planctomycetaceae bacterium]|nr:M24 family metallopeptidase [Planctomycetales bacterium]MCB9922658.1 M24 family metallopeptidase [Planctomycetaceae bacterium]